jgi:hypothetical protein
VATAAVAARQSSDAPAAQEVFTATAVTPGGPRSSAEVTPVELTITGWSSQADRQRLIETVRQKGADAMLDVLRELEPVGSIKVPGNLAYDLRYAHQAQLPEGGRRIFLATDRPMTHWEIANRPRVSQYPFTFIELRLDGEGQGEGKLALATKVDVSRNGEHIELVNYTEQPIQLNNVKKR